MKILLDENIPVDLKLEFSNTEYEVFTVRDFSWIGIKNGELLKRMVSNKFDVLITMDKKLKNQQNILNLKLTIFVLDAFNNKTQTLKPFIHNVIQTLESNVSVGNINVKV